MPNRSVSLHVAYAQLTLNRPAQVRLISLGRRAQSSSAIIVVPFLLFLYLSHPVSSRLTMSGMKYDQNCSRNVRLYRSLVCRSLLIPCEFEAPIGSSCQALESTNRQTRKSRVNSSRAAVCMCARVFAEPPESSSQERAAGGQAQYKSNNYYKQMFASMALLCKRVWERDSRRAAASGKQRLIQAAQPSPPCDRS